MEETGDLTHETLIHIVDKSIEEAGAQFQGYHIIISQDGRYQHTISLAQQELLTRGTQTDMTVALYTHGDDKTIIFQQVTMERIRCLRDTYTEIR